MSLGDQRGWRRRDRRARLALASLALALTPACAPADDDSGHGLSSDLASLGTASAASADAAVPQVFEVPQPPFSEGVFPCSECHDPTLPVNAKRRTLKLAHQEIELRHDAEHRWCLDCHAAGDRDKLHLASGEMVPFEESYRLCGQCHGDKYRDWRAGVHGRRVGRWDGEKQYLLCVHCHNAHSPKFQPLKPMPPPPRPERTR
jgi:hypothetical protein